LPFFLLFGRHVIGRFLVFSKPLDNKKKLVAAGCAIFLWKSASLWLTEKHLHWLLPMTTTLIVAAESTHFFIAIHLHLYQCFRNFSFVFSVHPARL
jgi:hypothetical protein